MANSQFQYVRSFELPDALPPSNWIIIRLDGRSFSKFTTRHSFAKPNDPRCLHLMNACATSILQSFTDVVLAYGQSDEYSFVLHENTTLFDRRSAKLATSVATMFTAEFCMQWPTFFPGVPLTRPWPTFDGRCVAYPKRKILRDYLSWRQADCHINNLYNTTFWNLVLEGGRSQRDAEEELKGTLSKDKNELLWREFGVNYNNEEEMFKKGSVVYRGLGEPEPAPKLVTAVAKGADEGVAKADSPVEAAVEKEYAIRVVMVANGEAQDLDVKVKPSTPISHLVQTSRKHWNINDHWSVDLEFDHVALEPSKHVSDTAIGNLDVLFVRSKYRADLDKRLSTMGSVENIRHMAKSVSMSGPSPAPQVPRQQKAADPQSKTQQEKAKKRKQKARVVVEHVDVIGDAFWDARPYILGEGE